MPVVKTEELYIKPLGKGWRKKIEFNSKTGNFSIKMPREYQSLFPDAGPPTAKTLDDVESEFRRVVYLWQEAAIKVRKVILYRFAVSVPSGRNDFESSFEHHPEHAVGFQWEVCRERTVGDEVKYFQIDLEADENEGHEMFVHRPYINLPDEESKETSATRVLDWTEERAKFFEALEVSLKGLVQRVVQFERQISDPKVLDRLASGSSFNLLLPERKS